MGRGRKFSTSELFDTTERVLLTVGYEGFTIGLLAENLGISRAAIYKYYMNKEALIVDFMIERMTVLIDDLQKIDDEAPFLQQLDELLHVIFQSKDLHQILGYSHFINDRGDKDIAGKLQQLLHLHHAMYSPMQQMVEQGKVQGILSEEIPSELILGFIFQSISIPNHSNIEKVVFLSSIKQMMFHGIIQK